MYCKPSAPAEPAGAVSRHSGRGTLRIIGGTLRSRRIRFEGMEGLRPTPDRVRETLFNWLAPVIRGARCLDLFAGSGAIGFEAFSRGAARVILVENHPRAFRNLEDNVAQLGAGPIVRLVRDSAWDFLARDAGPYDIVFLDPPFDSASLDRALTLLIRRGLLAPGALVYCERRAVSNAGTMPPGYELHRGGRAGDVEFRLLRPVDTDRAATTFE